jgi:hypothetical protein
MKDRLESETSKMMPDAVALLIMHDIMTTIEVIYQTCPNLLIMCYVIIFVSRSLIVFRCLASTIYRSCSLYTVILQLG